MGFSLTDSLQEIKEVYSSMQDDLSRGIFMDRLNYFVTQNSDCLFHMDEMCLANKSEHIKSFYDLLDNTDLCKSGIVLFGAGDYGHIFSKLASEAGIEVKSIWDTSERRHGETINGVKVTPPPRDFWGFNSSPVPVVIASTAYRGEIYDELVKSNINRDYIYMPKPYKESYFEEGFFRPKKNERYIDCGAFNGDTVKSFIKWCGGDYDKIYAFEPGKTLQQLRDACGELRDVEIIPKGAFSHTGTVKFLIQEGYGGDTINESGRETIETVTIDDVCGGARVTTIKMDIEGSELEALKGAKKTILQNRPQLAICVYHKPEDILTIPLIIKQYCQDYRFWLRHYSCYKLQGHFWETVLYAVPN